MAETDQQRAIRAQLNQLGATPQASAPPPTPGATPGNEFAAALAQGGAGLPVQFKIPVFRIPGPRKGTDVVGANGLTRAEAARYGIKYVDKPKMVAGEKFDADGASAQFGILLQDRVKLQEWQQIALAAGLINPDNAHDAVALGKAWDQAVGWALRIAQATGGRTEITPFEAAKMVGQNVGSELLAKQNFAAERARLAEETFTGTKSFTQSQTDLRASNAPESVLRDLLGRKPTKGEMAAYSQGVMNVAKQNPVTQTGKSTFENGQKVSEDITLSGGFDVQAAQTQAASSATPEVAMMQNASTHYNALLQAIQAAV